MPHLADELRLSVDMILRYITGVGIDQRTPALLEEARAVLWDASVQLMDHLDEEASKSPGFHDEFGFLKHGLNHGAIAFRHMWSYVLDFIKQSELTGDALEKMLEGIVAVGKAILQMEPMDDEDSCLPELVDLENEAYKGEANEPLKLFFEKWENRTDEPVG